MGLQSIDEAGNLAWQCPHTPDDADRCGTPNSAHISHEAVQWHGMEGMAEKHQMISLPPCSGCGAQTFLKVHFSDKELQAPNMWQIWDSIMEVQQQRFKQMLEHAEHYAQKPTIEILNMLKSQIATMEQVKQAGGQHTATHAMALRHMELARQMTQAGKIPIAVQGVSG